MEYRIDVLSQDRPDRPLHFEYFTAPNDEKAIKTATPIVVGHVTDPETQYGDLYIRDADGADYADYVDTIEVAA